MCLTLSTYSYLIGTFVNGSQDGTNLFASHPNASFWFYLTCFHPLLHCRFPSRAHQNHYEQLGEIHGSVKIDAIEYPLNLHVMRDHTHGSIRDWRLMHRYGIQSFTTQNGFRCARSTNQPNTQISPRVFVFFRGFMGTVCQPGIFSNLELGYVMTSQGQCAPIEEVDLPLWAHGEGGQHPTDFAFRFKAEGIWHEIQVIMSMSLSMPLVT